LESRWDFASSGFAWFASFAVSSVFHPRPSTSKNNFKKSVRFAVAPSARHLCSNALAASKQATADKDAAIAALAAAANQIAAYVDLTANGDESKILSAGLSIRAARTPQTVPGQVMNLSLTTSDNAGALDAHWDSLPGAKSFEVQTSPDPFTDATWRTADTVTNSTVTLTGFTSGAKIWVRVRAINSKGKGPWSDVATKIVP
jgi:hypothetical protein